MPRSSVDSRFNSTKGGYYANPASGRNNSAHRRSQSNAVRKAEAM